MGLLDWVRWDQNLIIFLIIIIDVGYLPDSLRTAQFVVLSLTPSSLLQNLICMSSIGFLVLSIWMKFEFFLFTGKHIVLGDPNNLRYSR